MYKWTGQLNKDLEAISKVQKRTYQLIISFHNENILVRQCANYIDLCTTQHASYFYAVSNDTEPDYFHPHAQLRMPENVFLPLRVFKCKCDGRELVFVT